MNVPRHEIDQTFPGTCPSKLSYILNQVTATHLYKALTSWFGKFTKVHLSLPVSWKCVKCVEMYAVANREDYLGVQSKPELIRNRHSKVTWQKSQDCILIHLVANNLKVL